MKLTADFMKHGLVCHVELVFTSATKEGVHYFQMTKPKKVTNKRFTWEPNNGEDILQPMLQALEYLMSEGTSKYWSRLNANT